MYHCSICSQLLSAKLPIEPNGIDQIAESILSFPVAALRTPSLTTQLYRRHGSTAARKTIDLEDLTQLSSLLRDQ